MGPVLKLHFVSALLLCTFLKCSTPSLVDEQTEPSCLSRFDHDYKVLQKLADLEQKLKGLEQRLSTEDLEQRLIVLEQRLATETGGCAAAQCQNGWIRYNGSCYLFVNHVKMDWFKAKQYCDGIPGGHLAFMETWPEQEFLTQHTKNMASSGSYPFYWVGATDEYTEGHWVWYTGGTAVSEGGSVWYPGQPVDSTSENCGCLWGDEDFTFHDCTCTDDGYIICERDMNS